MTVQSDRCEWQLLVWTFLACLGLCFLPHVLLGTQTHVQIHDHLDADAPLASVLADGHYLFASNATRVMPVFDGLLRIYLGSEFNLYNLLFTVLPPLGALLVNEFLMRCAAFWGMALLLRDHVLAEHPRRAPLVAIGATAFATLQFWPPGGMAAAGVPLVTWAFLQTRAHGLGGAPIAVAMIFALYSNPVYVTPFLLFAAAPVLLWDLARGARKSFAHALALIALTCLLQVAAHWRLLASVLAGLSRTSQRIEMISPWLDTAGQSFAALYAREFFLPWHSRFIILPLALVALGAALLPRQLATPHRQARPLMLWLLGVAVLCGIPALWYLDRTQKLWHALGLPFFDWSRFINLQPTAWVVIFALGMALAWHLLRGWPRLATALIVVLGLGQAVYNLSSITQYADWYRGVPGFRSFYAPDLFARMRRDMDGGFYRVGSLGLHPGIALYNGFATVDGLLPYYPVDYKHRFQAVIEGELARDPDWRRYFQNSGARLYLFSKDLAVCDFLCTRDKAPQTVTLHFDMTAFRALGGRYLISVSTIGNAGALHLKQVGVYGDGSDAWRLHLYRLE